MSGGDGGAAAAVARQRHHTRRASSVMALAVLPAMRRTASARGEKSSCSGAMTARASRPSCGSRALGLTLLLATAQGTDTQRHLGNCPNFTAFGGAFPDMQRNANGCTVVTYAAAVSAASTGAGANHPWTEGMAMFANHTNGQGGLRLGMGKLGYVALEVKELRSAFPQDYIAQYTAWCGDPKIHVLLAPISSSIATAVLTAINAIPCNKPFLAADTDTALFAVNGPVTPWSVQGSNSRDMGSSPVDFLHQLGARTFTIVAKNTAKFKEIQVSLASAVLGRSDTHLLDSKYYVSSTKISQVAVEVEGKQPDVFIAVGDVGLFEVLLSDFKGSRYAPKVAFFMEGLAATAYMQRESYTVKGCQHCLVYNQWMGTVEWSPQMPYLGKNNWTDPRFGGDPYSDSGSVQLPPVAGDRRDVRYMGGAVSFTPFAREWLKRNNAHLREPDPYHAKAFASMLILQMAMELVPGTDGGLTLAQMAGTPALASAKGALDVNTFWGPINLDTHGFNTKFQIGIAQFQAHDSVLDAVPTLVGPASLMPGHVAAGAIYPAEWPCDLTDSCDITEGWTLWEVLGAWFLGVACVLMALAACYVKRDVVAERKASLLARGSLYTRNTDSLLKEGMLSESWYATANQP